MKNKAVVKKNNKKKKKKYGDHYVQVDFSFLKSVGYLHPYLLHKEKVLPTADGRKLPVFS